MAKTSGGRSEAATAIFAVVALVVVAAFLAWLAMTSEPSVVAAPTTDGDTLAMDQPAVPVAADQFSDPTTYVGQTVSLENVTVGEAFGTQLLVVTLPQGSYVVHRTGLAAAAATPASGSQVTVVGRVLEKTPEVIDTWVSSGAITQAQVARVQPGATYIEARELRAAGS